MKLDTLGMNVSWLSRCPRHGEWRRGCMGCGWGVRSKGQTGVFFGLITRIFPVSWSASSYNRCVWRSVLQPSTPEIPRQNRRSGPPDQWAGRWKVRRNVYHRVAGQCDLNCSSLQVGPARNGHWVVDYTTADKDGCAAPAVSLCGGRHNRQAGNLDQG